MSAQGQDIDESPYSCTAGQSLVDVLANFQSYGFRVIYSSELVKNWMRVESAEYFYTEELLKSILKPFGLDMEPGVGGSLLVVASEYSSGLYRHYIRGQVLDAKTGEALSGARIWSDELGALTHTTNDGCYFLEGVRFGMYTIQVEIAGYQSEKIVMLVSQFDPIWIKSQLTKSNKPIGTHVLGDRSMEPVIRANPPYPLKAMVDNVSGIVVLEFTLTAEGLVKDPNIINATPKGYFEKNALDAVQRLRYRRYRFSGEPPSELKGVRYTFKYLR